MRYQFVLLALAALAGCASTSHTQWTRPGATEEDLRIERAQCDVQAAAIRDGPGTFRAFLVFETCMTGKGWQAVLPPKTAQPINGFKRFGQM